MSASKQVNESNFVPEAGSKGFFKYCGLSPVGPAEELRAKLRKALSVASVSTWAAAAAAMALKAWSLSSSPFRERGCLLNISRTISSVISTLSSVSRENIPNSLSCSNKDREDDGDCPQIVCLLRRPTSTRHLSVNLKNYIGPDS